MFEVEAPATCLALVSAGRDEQENETYEVSEYHSAPGLTLSGFFNPPPTPSHSRTALWIDLDRGTLSKAEGSIAAVFQDGSEAEHAFKHGFASYGEDISISAPPKEGDLTPETE